VTRVVLLLAAVACATPPRPASHELPHDPLYDANAAAFVATERYRGHVVVLDFWAGWCAECRKTVPQVARLAAAFATDGLVVVGVNAGEKPGDVATYAKELGITYPIALDPDLAFSDHLGATDLPVLVVVDRNGAIVHRTRHLDAETLAVIRRLLHAPTASP
jgi:thiol-disulfide isomerase/thioredoxin